MAKIANRMLGSRRPAPKGSAERFALDHAAQQHYCYQ